MSHEKEPQRTAGQKATHDAAVAAQSGTGKTPAQVVREAQPGSQVATPNVNTVLRGDGADPVVPVETQRARDLDAARLRDGGAFDADGYPVARTDQGATEQVAKLMNHLGAITDVGALATVLAAVVGRCQACRVRPDVLEPIVAGLAGVEPKAAEKTKAEQKAEQRADEKQQAEDARADAKADQKRREW